MLRVTVQSATNRVVGRGRALRRGGRAKLRLTGVAEVGGYKYFVRRGRKVVAKGGFSVRPSSRATLADSRRMALRVR
jgi:hypothetical protein